VFLAGFTQGSHKPYTDSHTKTVLFILGGRNFVADGLNKHS
jgi:hypothetical protein